MRVEMINCFSHNRYHLYKPCFLEINLPFFFSNSLFFNFVLPHPHKVRGLSLESGSSPLKHASGEFQHMTSSVFLGWLSVTARAEQKLTANCRFEQFQLEDLSSLITVVWLSILKLLSAFFRTESISKDRIKGAFTVRERNYTFGKGKT